MKQVQRLATFTAVLLLVYSLTVVRTFHGVVIENRPTPEVFPFFAWELFSRVPPAEQEAVALRFVEINGEVLDPPVYFEKADTWLSNSRSPTAYHVIRQLGSALEQSQLMRAAIKRELLESRFMQDVRTAEYEIVKVRFDILERFECDCYIEEMPLARFTLGE